MGKRIGPMMKEHPAASIFPMMDGDEYEQFKADIKANGQRQPVIFWKTLLVDGRNRMRACTELGIEPLTMELPEDANPVQWIVSENIMRRHLSASQRAMYAAQIETLGRGGDRKSENFQGNTQEKQTGKIAPSVEDAAKTAKVSPRLVKDARKVLKDGAPEVVDAVKSGKVSASEAAKVVRNEKDKAKQAEVIKAKPEKPKPEPAKEEADGPRAVGPLIIAEASKLDKILRELERLADLPGGFWLSMPTIRERLSLLKHGIRGAAYWVDCPGCKGAGCRTCKDQGWLSKDRKQFLTQAHKDILGV